MMDGKPVDTKLPSIRIPPLSPPAIHDNTTLSEWVHETTEWLGLVGLCSSRVQEGDTLDSNFHRYSLPAVTPATGTSIRRIRWSGLLNNNFVTKLLIHLLYVCCPRFMPITNFKTPSYVHGSCHTDRVVCNRHLQRLLTTLCCPINQVHRPICLHVSYWAHPIGMRHRAKPD